MINNDQEMEAALDRIRQFQAQLAHLRRVETNSANYRLSASGFLAEIDRMQLEVREYLSLPPSEHTVPVDVIRTGADRSYSGGEQHGR